MYESHFKKIIFYSDYPLVQDDEVNFINIHRGFHTQTIFYHFYKKYKTLLEDSDGLFYTMDDNIVNVNILHLFDSSKILYYPPVATNTGYDPNTYRGINLKNWFKLDSIDTLTGWNWDNRMAGKNTTRKNIKRLLLDKEFQKYTIHTFSAAFSDWFFLPKKYVTEDVCNIFELFAKYEIFLEIAIPSVIYNIEPNVDKYQSFTHDVLWSFGADERSFFLKKKYMYNSLHHTHNLILHPIKFNQHPSSKEWLQEFLCKEKCIVITTTHKPTETILKHIENTDYDVIIVGDENTPEDYKTLQCIYLDIPSQKKLFPELSEVLPYNHSSRKNLGYLYAIKKGYKVIYETVDYNIPYDNFDTILQCTGRSGRRYPFNTTKMISEQNSVLNVCPYFLTHASGLKHEPNYSIQDTDRTPSIIQGLVENGAICTHRDSVRWDTINRVLIDNKNVCVLNTQNTFWLNQDLYMCLFLPCSGPFQQCDMLRGIIANIVLKQTKNYMMYSSPNVIQNTNEHTGISDSKSEYEMYIHNETILNFIENDTANITSVKELLCVIYTNLFAKGVIPQKDRDVLNTWLTYFSTSMV